MFVVYWSALHHSGEHVNTLSSTVSSCILCFAVTTSECVHMNVMYICTCMLVVRMSASGAVAYVVHVGTL